MHIMMAFLKKLYQGAARQLADVFLGDPVREWGVVHERPGRFFSEAISVDLYRQDGQLILWLKSIYKSRISYHSYGFAISVRDLRDFVDTLLSGYEALCRLARMPRPLTANRHDRLPFVHRLLLKAIFGIRTSKLLLDHGDRVSHENVYRIYGFVTRTADPKIFIQSELDISNQHGTVISGECLAAVLQVLADFLDAEEAATTGSRQDGSRLSSSSGRVRRQLPGAG